MFSRPAPTSAPVREVASSAAPGQIALAALAVAAVGVVDAALVTFRIAGAGGAFEYVPPRIWVVAPATWAVVATLAAGAVLLATRRWVGHCVAAIVGVVFIAIRLRAHPLLLLLVLALFAVTTLAAARTINRWMARAHRSTAVGILAILAASPVFMAAGPPVSPSETERYKDAGPNVILIFLDTVRYDAVFDATGRVHRDLETLGRLRRESTVFTRAYASSPWTLPSHLAAVTGLRPDELGVSFDSQRYERSQPTLAERYRERGYRTAAVISNSFLNAGSGFARGYDTFQQAQAGLDICRTAPGLMAERHWPWFSASVCNWTAGEVTRRALRLLADDERPFFLTLNYMDAHDPYYVESGCGTGRGYRAAVRCIDRNLAPIVDWRSTRRQTVLAILSDHGEQFGEHGLVRHGNSLYVQLLHVPMMIRWTEGSESRSHTGPLSIASLPALLDDAASTPLRPMPVPALLHPPAAGHQPAEWSALDASWHLIVRESGSEALYHLPTDPAEEHDLISAARLDPAVAQLRASVEEMRRTPRPDLRRFRSLGYVH